MYLYIHDKQSRGKIDNRSSRDFQTALSVHIAGVHVIIVKWSVPNFSTFTCTMYKVRQRYM